ncbi:hypothetical protein BDW74DRAFT_142040, partial [Aspergillus multicolor]|uniref:uncharacterized protein n=1 Tax=Aspergillus multicolor TaxID=41759 RepID=UPI003CCD17F2
KVSFFFFFFSSHVIQPRAFGCQSEHENLDLWYKPTVLRSSSTVGQSNKQSPSSRVHCVPASCSSADSTFVCVRVLEEPQSDVRMTPCLSLNRRFWSKKKNYRSVGVMEQYMRASHNGLGLRGSVQNNENPRDTVSLYGLVAWTALDDIRNKFACPLW